MKITNNDLALSVPALNMIAGLHLPVKTSFGLSKIVRAAKTAHEDYESLRLKLVNHHGKKDDQGKLIETRNPQNGQPEATIENKEAFDKDLKELHALPVEIPGEQIKLADLGNVNLPANALAPLHWLIAE